MRVHLIRHGEVENPDHVVYADLPGFALSARGREQARSAGTFLVQQEVATIVTSPLERALETSELISSITGAAVEVDERLVEWGLASHWAGVVWERLPDEFPGELEAYLADPRDLPFSPESLDEVAGRVAQCIADWAHLKESDVAFVSHEDPLHGARLLLTGVAPEVFHRDKPRHGSVTTLDSTTSEWSVARYWEPAQ